LIVIVAIIIIGLAIGLSMKRSKLKINNRKVGGSLFLLNG
jgi:uncharacterized membrane protein